MGVLPIFALMLVTILFIAADGKRYLISANGIAEASFKYLLWSANIAMTILLCSSFYAYSYSIDSRIAANIFIDLFPDAFFFSLASMGSFYAAHFTAIAKIPRAAAPIIYGIVFFVLYILPFSEQIAFSGSNAIDAIFLDPFQILFSEGISAIMEQISYAQERSSGNLFVLTDLVPAISIMAAIFGAIVDIVCNFARISTVSIDREVSFLLLSAHLICVVINIGFCILIIYVTRDFDLQQPWNEIDYCISQRETAIGTLFCFILDILTDTIDLLLYLISRLGFIVIPVTLPASLVFLFLYTKSDYK